MTAGAPSKYKEEYCEQLIKYMAKGLSYPAFAGSIGVCFDTLYNWETMYPDWVKAKKIGEAANLEKMEQLGMLAMHGKIKNFSASVYIFTVKNRHYNHYKETSEVTIKSAALPKDATQEQLAEAYDKMVSQK